MNPDSTDQAPNRFLYVFLDEAGNLDFSPNGTRYFLLGAITLERPFDFHGALDALRYDFIESGIDLEYFHATEDRQAVRDRVYAAIRPQMNVLSFDTVVADKRRIGSALKAGAVLYPRMVGCLLEYILAQYRLTDFKEVIVSTDRLPVQKKRGAVEKSIKTTLSDMLPTSSSYRLMHHESKAHLGLQIADYLTWAVYRKWDRGDTRSYDLVHPTIRSEFSFIRPGSAAE